MAISIRSTATSRTLSNATLTLNATKPSGVVAGDVLIAFVVVGDTGGVEPVFTAPAGWTLIQDQADHANGPANYIKLAAYWRLAGGSEPSTYTFTTSTATQSRFAVVINAYIGVDTTTPVAPTEVGSFANVTNQSTNERPTGSITTSTSRWIVTGVADRNNSTFTTPGSLTERALTNGQTPGAVVLDSNGYVSAGPVSYMLESSTISSTFVGIIFSLVDGNATPPVIAIDRPAANLVDLRGSTVGDASELTYSDPVHVSGPVLVWSELAEGIFLFEQSTGTTPSVYNFTVSQDDAQTADDDETIAPAAQQVVNISAPRRPAGSGPGTTWL